MNRTSAQYIAGIQAFLDFAFANAGNSKVIVCPCKRCVLGHNRWFNRDEVTHHLMFYGFLPNYTDWVHHGEEEIFGMEFRSLSMPNKKTGASSSAGPRPSPPKTKSVQQETFEIIDEEETPQTGGATANPPPNKGKGKSRTKKVATTHPSAKRKRGENAPAAESLEELWVKMGLRLKEIGEVGPDALEEFSKGPPSPSSELDEKLKKAEAHNRELQELTARQLDEMANLSRMAGAANAEILRLNEENSQLMGEVSHLKEEAERKEQELPGRARQWMEENLVEAVRVLTSTPERTMEGFKLLYREEHGKQMITAVGSFGFMSGQKRDREATHEILADRDPDFNAKSYGLAPIPDEEPSPPFPLS
ncbi:unnamed protein product [Cuscuta campestris]|uniref:Transposase-associated domain-containing protein n=1 Tax=Cuscuta campestris TaxID=132261 RepID=A0A484NRF0_9ASTE|nr:unnamed protein product [Cuscuta campestris]